MFQVFRSTKRTVGLSFSSGKPMKDTQRDVADVIAETNPLWQFLERFKSKKALEEHTIKSWGMTWIQLQDCLRGKRSLTARQLIDIALDLDLTAQDVAAMFYKSSKFGVPKGTKVKVFTDPGPFTLVVRGIDPARHARLRSYLEDGVFAAPVKLTWNGMVSFGLEMALGDSAINVDVLRLSTPATERNRVIEGIWKSNDRRFSKPKLLDSRLETQGETRWYWLPIEFSLPVQPQFALKEK